LNPDRVDSPQFSAGIEKLGVLGGVHGIESPALIADGPLWKGASRVLKHAERGRIDEPVRALHCLLQVGRRRPDPKSAAFHPVLQ
jgi:hypothetical protein